MNGFGPRSRLGQIQRSARGASDDGCCSTCPRPLECPSGQLDRLGVDERKGIYAQLCADPAESWADLGRVIERYPMTVQREVRTAVGERATPIGNVGQFGSDRHRNDRTHAESDNDQAC